ncbi:PDZ domain-containing protein [Paenibacillus wenxiniae]|uniref:Serine protease n=1 Tax=Paenibacillus wenxiniae TaxID=1636843 RepID=A0ABW4RHL7_9BACL
MEILSKTLHIVLEIIVSLLTQPFYYIFLLAVLLHYRRQGLLERRLFNIRVHIYAGRVLRTVGAGLLVGALASLVMTGVGIHTQPQLVWIIGGLIVILSLFRLRLAHLIDALALLSLVYMILWFVPDGQFTGWLRPIVDAIRDTDWMGLFALAVLLHVAEAVLFRLQAPGLSSPVAIEGKRGKPVGAYTLDAFWPIPVWLLVPAVGGWMLPWQPLHHSDVWSAGVTLAVLPVMIGTSVLTQSELPQVKARIISKQLWQSSLVLIVLAVAAYWWQPLALLGIWIGVIWREYIVHASRRQEAEQMPMYTHSLRGLRILAVIPGSPADELGIKSAETMYKANGIQVHSPQSLHKALRMNPAFCKLEVLNRDGESKFLQRAIYAGEHHQLGMIFVPEDDAVVTKEAHRLHAFHLLRKPAVSKGIARSPMTVSAPAVEEIEHTAPTPAVVDSNFINRRSRTRKGSSKQSGYKPSGDVIESNEVNTPVSLTKGRTTSNIHADPAPNVDISVPVVETDSAPSVSTPASAADGTTGLPKRSRKTDHR